MSSPVVCRSALLTASPALLHCTSNPLTLIHLPSSLPPPPLSSPTSYNLPPRETLRVYPVVNALFRQAKTDIQLAGEGLMWWGC